jgi:hypothetical protein
MSAITMTSDSIIKMQNTAMPKQATRRVIKPQPDGVAYDDDRCYPYVHISVERFNKNFELETITHTDSGHRIVKFLKRPHASGKPMRIKESLERGTLFPGTIFYAADNVVAANTDWEWPHATLPAMFCPVWASRYNPIVTACYPQRLHDMTEADAKKEGCATLAEYIQVWDQINEKKYPWQGNWWVWVTEFEPVVERVE